MSQLTLADPNGAQIRAVSDGSRPEIDRCTRFGNGMVHLLNEWEVLVRTSG
jgi:hypothetical protein